MTVQNISFMAVKPNKAVIDNAAKKAEVLKTTNLKSYRESDIKSYLDSRQQIIKEEVEQGSKEIQSYLASRQPIIKEEADVSADEIAKAYKAAHGIQ